MINKGVSGVFNYYLAGEWIIVNKKSLMLGA